jgi:hypothetical protein
MHVDVPAILINCLDEYTEIDLFEPRSAEGVLHPYQRTIRAERPRRLEAELWNAAYAAMLAAAPEAKP